MFIGPQFGHAPRILYPNHGQQTHWSQEIIWQKRTIIVQYRNVVA
jgi:hypothetical protein